VNRFFPATLVLLILLCSSFSADHKAPKYQIRTVVIDPGHGGHDSGCLGSSSQEKHIALAVSLKLGALIEKYLPEVKVIYTRKTDVFVELHERAAIANRAKADLFICIHCNSGPSTAFGAETYVMGLHKTADNLAVAKRENSAILLEKDYQTNYDGFDPHSPEANIIFSLYQNTFMHQSLNFASHVQKQLEHTSGRFNRGVKQAGFLVLFRTAMPSVLIELGFLTNRSDEKFLASESGQDVLAKSLLTAFQNYKAETERRAGSAPADEPPVRTQASAKGTRADEQVELKKEERIADNQPVDGSSSSSANTSPGEKETGRIFYTIQVGAIANSAVGDETRFNKLPEIRKLIGGDGMTRFYSGVYDSLDETRAPLQKLRESGFRDAFICAFQGARRISVSEATQLNKRK
jgi:N-acetylmuramoyl-L-alanine amidase